MVYGDWFLKGINERWKHNSLDNDQNVRVRWPGLKYHMCVYTHTLDTKLNTPVPHFSQANICFYIQTLGAVVELNNTCMENMFPNKQLVNTSMSFQVPLPTSFLIFTPLCLQNWLLPEELQNSSSLFSHSYSDTQ